MHDQDDRRGREQGDRREIDGGVERKLAVERLIDRERPGRGEQQRVAVRVGLGHRLRAGIATAARPVLHDELLAQLLAELLRQEARHHVDGATRRIRIDDAHDAVGIVLGRRRPHHYEQNQHEGGTETQNARHRHVTFRNLYTGISSYVTCRSPCQAGLAAAGGVFGLLAQQQV